MSDGDFALSIGYLQSCWNIKQTDYMSQHNFIFMEAEVSSGRNNLLSIRRAKPIEENNNN